jgi:diacylglycerol kinase family enzyme
MGGEHFSFLPTLVSRIEVPNHEPPGRDPRALVLNPACGDGTHVERVGALAAEYGYELRHTSSAADISDTVAEAAREASLVAVAGGDGTLTRAVRGLDEADAFGDTLMGIVPAGTGNNFAGNAGYTGLEQSFEVIESGQPRRIDLGVVDDTPFLNSCVAGLTAESSAATEREEKERWGVLAYAMTTLRTASEFDGLHLVLEPHDGETIEADATLVLVGNGRRFPKSGRTQANMEDGLLEVTVVRAASRLDQIGESVRHWFGADTPHLEEFRTADLEVTLEGEYDSVSVDGEITTADHLTMGIRPGTLWIPVGGAYRSDPDA